MYLADKNIFFIMTTLEGASLNRIIFFYLNEAFGFRFFLLKINKICLQFQI
ncbi:hypothetical protein SAMN05421544_11225 [Riemerella columbipharyngis]|uniref:Uncharacterized protein n=1 Tax=Riemerella columbipharyngis TaxID=1071918 RepID=A0A1G7DRE2_9FLAO|nr:hypothetical protein SAMN05421544_11225 [Riemerella columbipharyngis]